MECRGKQDCEDRVKVSPETFRAILAYHLIELARKLLAGENVDSIVDSDKKRGNSKLTQPPEEVAHPLGVEPKTF